MPKLNNVKASTTTKRVIKAPAKKPTTTTAISGDGSVKTFPVDHVNTPLRPVMPNPFFPIVPVNNDNDIGGQHVALIADNTTPRAISDIAFPMLQLTYQPEPVTEPDELFDLKFDPHPITDAIIAEQRSVTTATEPANVSPDVLANIVIGISSVQPAQASQPAATSDVADLTDRVTDRLAAKAAVREFYGADDPKASLPFKPAAELKFRAAINFARFTPGSISGTARTAGLLAAIIAYCVVQPDGTFVRGSGRVPYRLIGIDKPGECNAGAESGALSRLIGTGAVRYVSGPTHGPGAENGVYRIVKSLARKNMLSFNEKLASGEHRFSRVLMLLGN